MTSTGNSEKPRKRPSFLAPWPAMPVEFLNLAARAAAEAEFAHYYDPDACPINRYIAGAKLGLHQDRDEEDARAPIVSVSLGVPAVYSCGGRRNHYPLGFGLYSRAPITAPHCMHRTRITGCRRFATSSWTALKCPHPHFGHVTAAITN